MEKIERKQLQSIRGGISIWGVLGLGALAAFLSGVIDGIARPIRCN